MDTTRQAAPETFDLLGEDPPAGRFDMARALADLHKHDPEVADVVSGAIKLYRTGSGKTFRPLQGGIGMNRKQRRAAQRRKP